MARTSLENIMSLGDPAQAWQFDLRLPIIPGSSDTTDLTYRCMTSDLPGSQVEPLDVALHGTQVPYMGRRMYTQTINIQFLETVDWETCRKFVRWHDIARPWRALGGTRGGVGSLVYRATAFLDLYNDANEVVRTVRIMGAWPDNVQDMQLDGSATAALQPNISLKYIDWRED